jgi:glyoxylase-like metal-dependent hydrolase (beta-lactamase superfamily II)/ferredoxin
MARVADRMPENAAGSFYVDSTCIDCDICRQLAPDTFRRDDRLGQSIVQAQPRGTDATHRALLSLVACPTSSIGSVDKLDARAASHAFPIPVTGDVYFCGYASEASYGAQSWLYRRACGNVLVDSPRAARPLMERIEELGGVRWMFLTHRDDVADHEAYARRFGCERVMHRADAPRGIERVVDGVEPVALAEDLLVIPVPGHTRGSAALLAGTTLFTGDHLWGSEDDDGVLEASQGVAWWSWREQLKSIEKLLAYDFTSVLPGHGRRFHAESPEAMRRAIRTFLGRP